MLEKLLPAARVMLRIGAALWLSCHFVYAEIPCSPMNACPNVVHRLLIHSGGGGAFACVQKFVEIQLPTGHVGRPSGLLAGFRPAMNVVLF